MMDPNCNKTKVKQEKEIAAAEADNLRMILVRQITTGIWKEPIPSYANKLKQRKALEQEIHAATGERFPDRSNEDIYEMNLYGLYKKVGNAN